ncbi:hypothetical protein ACFCVU_19900 [Peribacillus butanolivorans]|uniref:hypothetical protein n=1 Tax=Peribacillus butanolivorans TaxID=421767 RepID=UPI0035DA8A54
MANEGLLEKQQQMREDSIERVKWSNLLLFFTLKRYFNLISSECLKSSLNLDLTISLPPY